MSFPPDVFIRLLRKNLENKKVDGEEWWEGVYDGKIGFFPAIFVQSIGDFSEKDASFMSSPVKNCTSNENSEQKPGILSPFSENQKVPQ